MKTYMEFSALNRGLLVCGIVGLSCLGFGQTVSESDFSKQVSAATALYREGKVDEARVQFEELHRINPRSSDVDAWLGFLYLRLNKPSQAVILLEAAEAQRPRDLEVQINLGNAYMATGELDRALDKYKNVSRMSPLMFEPYYNSGTIYLRQKAYSKAVLQLVNAGRLKPTDPFVQNNLGVAYDNLHDTQHAAKAFKKAADLSPNNLTFAHNAGLALAKVKSPEALGYLEKCLGDGTDPAVALALGEAYSRAGRKADALKYYEGLRVAEAKNSTFWFNLGVLRAQNQDAKGAEEAYRKALEINPNDLDALNNLGLIAFRKGDFEEATTLFDKLSGLNPTSISAKLNLAAAAVKVGDLKKAVSAWKEVIRADGSRVEVRLDLANALFDQGDVENARFHYLQVLAVDKNNAEAFNGVGLCHLKTSKLVQAEAAFRSAIDADPKLIGAYNNLAVTLQRMNQVKEAVKILEKALKIAPDREDIKRNLSRMRGEG